MGMQTFGQYETDVILSLSISHLRIPRIKREAAQILTH